MKKFFAMLILGALTGLCACNVSPLFNAPITRQQFLDMELFNAELCSPFLGTFVQTGSDTKWHFQARLDNGKFSGTRNGMLGIQAISTTGEKSRNLPLAAVVMPIGTQNYIIMCADMERICNQNNIAYDFIGMVRPYFYVMEYTFSDSENTLDLKFVSFTEGEKNHPVGTDSSIKLMENCVTNTPEEIQKLLIEKKYKTVNELTFKRKESARKE